MAVQTNLGVACIVIQYFGDCFVVVVFVFFFFN
jgi:hypothetical protein